MSDDNKPGDDQKNPFEDDQVDFGAPDDDEFEDFEGGGTTLGDMWRNNPLVKIGVIAGGLITIIGAIILFGGGEDPTLPSKVDSGQDVVEAPGTGPVSEEYRQAVQERNIQIVEDAVRTGESAIPTPVDTPVARLELPEDDFGDEDPLERWRRIQEERTRQRAQEVDTEPLVDPNADAIDALANAMAAQMEGILESKGPLPPIHIVVTEADFLQQQMAEAQQGDPASTMVEQDTEIINILLPAGTVEYAQLITEANSDIPGPILAQVASGPLAGARLIGNFEVANDYLVLTFDRIIIDGITHPTEAIAMDPDTTRLGMVTDIDRRYFTRIILPAAAAFVEGMGEAISETNETTVVVDGGSAVSSEEELDTQEELFKGLEKATEKIGELLDEQASQTQPLIRVETGTPMGLLFLEPVTDETR